MSQLICLHWSPFSISIFDWIIPQPVSTDIPDPGAHIHIELHCAHMRSEAEDASAAESSEVGCQERRGQC